MLLVIYVYTVLDKLMVQKHYVTSFLETMVEQLVASQTCSVASFSDNVYRAVGNNTDMHGFILRQQ